MGSGALPQWRKASRFFVWLIWLAALSAWVNSCAKPRALSDLLPKQAGSWQLGQARIMEHGAPPGAVEAIQAEYTGTGSPPVTVILYRMASQPSAFEAVQKWQPKPGESVTWKDNLFIVFSGADSEAVRAFSKAWLAGL